MAVDSTTWLAALTTGQVGDVCHDLPSELWQHFSCQWQRVKPLPVAWQSRTAALELRCQHPVIKVFAIVRHQDRNFVMCAARGDKLH